MPEQLVSCPEGSMKETVQANPSRVAKEIAEELVVRYGIEGAYKYVNQRLDGERGEKITFADASLLFLAIGAIEEEERRAPRLLTETGFIGTKRQILRRKIQTEIDKDMEIGQLRTQEGFLASGFSAIAEWAGGSKDLQIFLGHVGSLAGQGAEVFCDRVKNC